MKRKNLIRELKGFFSSPFGQARGEHQPDYIFLGALFLICFLGLLLLSSASSVQSFQQYDDSYHFVKRQFFRGLLPGLFLFFVFSRLNLNFLKKYSLWFLIGSLILLVAVFIPKLGVSSGQTRSWLEIGSLRFQPSEILKLTFIIYLAAWLENKSHSLEMKNLKYTLLPFLFFLTIVTILILAQPDLGTFLIIMAIAGVVYFAAGAPWSHLAGMVAGFLLIVFLTIQVAPYRLDRIASFFNPEIDPQGSSYQIQQAKLAIGSGGLLGLGIGKSRQKFNYLPEVKGDSIFAIIAEEMGFIFSLLFLGLFLTIMLRGLKIARASPDNFTSLLAIGITGWFSFQAFINIGAMVGVLPLTGIPLPFVSYGGTALTISLVAGGILTKISKQTTD